MKGYWGYVFAGMALGAALLTVGVLALLWV